MSSDILPNIGTPPLDKSRAIMYDIRLYRDLVKKSSLPPTPFMLPFMGEQAVGLYERRYVDGATWWSFRKMVSTIFRDIPIKTSTISTDGQVLASVPETDRL